MAQVPKGNPFMVIWLCACIFGAVVFFVVCGLVMTVVDAVKGKKQEPKTKTT